MRPAEVHVQTVRIQTVRVQSVAWLLLLALLLALPAHSAPFTSIPARAAAQQGMLAMLHTPEKNSERGSEHGAAIHFYSADAKLAHTLPLPPGVEVSASSLAPDGRHLAYLRGAVSGPEVIGQSVSLQRDLTLHLLRTTDHTEVAAIPLVPINFPNNVGYNAIQLVARDPSLGDVGDIAEAVWQAFKYSLGTLAWSPDGTQLAFSSGRDGPSSDLYLFDTADSSVTRLTDGIEQIDGIRWSPDGAWIWHSTVSFAYCQACDGHHFAAAADGNSVTTPPGSDVFRFLAWTGAHSYLVTDGANGPGDFALQWVDAATGEGQMLWEGTHQRFIYDAENARLAIVGTRGQTYDPDEQVFILDLATGSSIEEVAEYDDLERALAAEGWLLPLAEMPITYPCHRAGMIVRPCNDTPYDPLSPDGAYRVTDRFGVIETSSGDLVLPPESELGAGSVLWRPDSAGFFITQRNLVVYRDLASGSYTLTEAGKILSWLPLADPAEFATSEATPPAPAPLAPPADTGAPTVESTPEATPAATAQIEIPIRRDVMSDPFPETARTYRMAQARELATLAQSYSSGESVTDEAAREQGRHLLLAYEAAATLLDPPSPHPAESATPDPALVTEVSAALDAALAASSPVIATYPSGGDLSNSYTVALSPDGSIVATGNDKGNVFLWDYASGTLLRVLPSALQSVRQIHFSSDGTMLAATDQGSEVQMWTIESGMKSSTHVGQDYYTYALAWRPNTYDLAVANDSNPVMIHPRSKEAVALGGDTLNLSAEALAYSPNGETLAIAPQARYPTPDEVIAGRSTSPEERPILVVDADSGTLLYEFEDDRTTYFLSYTPDGETLIVGSGYLLRGWDLATQSLLFESALPDFPNGWAITPDGGELAILSRRAGISFFDLHSGAHVRDLPVDANVLAWLAIHPEEGKLITSDINGRPLLIDPESGATEFRFGPPRARLAATSPVASLLATADVRTITLFDMGTQRAMLDLHGAQNLIVDMAFSADGEWIAAREETGSLLVWDAYQGELQWRAEISSEWGGRVAFTPNGDIVTAGSDGILRLFSGDAAELLGEVDFNTQIMHIAVSNRNEATVIIGDPNSIAVRVDLETLAEGTPQRTTVAEAATIRTPPVYSPDGSLLAVVRNMSVDSTLLTFYDTASNEIVQSIELGSVYAIGAVAFSPDGTRFATGAHYGPPIRLWDVASGELISTVGMGSSTKITTRLAFSPDGTQLIATDGYAMTTQYSVAPSHTLRTVTGHRGSVWDVTVRPNSRWAATAGDDHTVRFWDWQTGAPLPFQIEEPERVYTVRYSPDGNSLLTGNDDGKVRLYDAGGTLQRTFQGHASWIVDAIFRPDGNAIATLSEDGTLIAWNLSDGRQRWSVEGLPAGTGALAYSPDSTYLASSAGSGSDAAIYVWDAFSGEEITRLQGHGNYIIALEFSADGSLLASGSWDHTVKLWNLATGEAVATLQGHDAILTDLAFNTDGTRLATVAEDYTLRLWDVAAQTEQARIDMPRSLPWSVAFSEDNRALLTTHADGTLRTWLVNPADASLQGKIIAAAARVPRPVAAFTAQERKAYAIDSYIGSYPLSASSNINLRPEPYVKSLIVQRDDTGAETLYALTDEKFILASTDRGEQWRIVARLPLTFTAHSLGIPARHDDPLLVTSEQGLYRVGEDGSLTLIHSDALVGVSYSHTNPNELWAVRNSAIYRSEDGGATWGSVSNDLNSSRLYAPLLNTPPNNNPQIVVGNAHDRPALVVWRGSGNGFWERVDALPTIPAWNNREQGIAWDEGNRTFFFSGVRGELYKVDGIAAPDLAAIDTSIVEQFGIGSRPLPLAVGEGPTLYVNLITTYGPRFVRGTWDGDQWRWEEIRLPLVAAG
jgi:WD40 repeat protein